MPLHRRRARSSIAIAARSVGSGSQISNAGRGKNSPNVPVSGSRAGVT